ncbi:MAG: ABC transporter permease [Candidatus Saccharimonadales bacterium]
MKSQITQKYRYSLILLKELVITEFKLRYQGSVLGYLWSLLRPLFLFIIMYFVFVYFLRIGGDIPHWPIALLLGIVLWNFFAEVTNNGVTSIVNRGDIIRKINFPKYVIVIAGTISAFINLLLNLVVIAIFMAVSSVPLTWLAMLSPIYIVEIFTFALGIAFILSTIFVRIRDINYIWEVIMQGLFYASAVIYPIAMVIEKSELAAKVLLLNPVAQAIQDLRYVLINQDHTPTLSSLTGSWYVSLIPIILVIATFIFGALYFKKKSPGFAENV